MIMMRLFLLLALHALLLLFEVSDASRFTHETDKQALLEFKSLLSEKSSAAVASWNDSLPLCRWSHVTCGRKHKRVIGVDLSGLKLSGIISPSIGNLTFLRSLDLSSNNFHGSIPQEMGKLFRLHHLNVSRNVLSGGIPVGLSNCSRILKLDVMNNHLENGVPPELRSLTNLVELLLGENDLAGKLPAFLGNLTSLQAFDVTSNHMEGAVPKSMGRLTRLRRLRIGRNKFSGGFPPAIYNLSSLVILNVGSNRFLGNLRSDFGTFLPNLYELKLGTNGFTGTIPPTLFNISSLEKFSIVSNHMTGDILGLGKLRNLQYLTLSDNSLGNNSSSDLEFLDALTNCTQLRLLTAAFNRLGGKLPIFIGNLSTKLTFLALGGNLISGSIPPEIGKLSSMQTLYLGENLLTGRLPSSFGKLSELGVLLLHSNRMSGEIPSSLGNFSTLQLLYLSDNNLEGNIPPSLGNCSYLQEVQIGSNKLTGTVPRELVKLQSLNYLNVSYNSLTGLYPEDDGKLKLLSEIDVSYNKLSGRVPESLGNCLSMKTLFLQGNSFDGVLPDISRLSGLQYLDLSDNRLSGPIPGYLVNFSSLQYLNLSMNNFEGAIPMEGVFRNGSSVYFLGNKRLCGGIPEFHLKPCPVQDPRKRRKRPLVRTIIAICASLLLLFLIVICLCWFKKKKKKNTANNTANSLSEPVYERISYAGVYSATNGFSSSNLVGSGNFSSVFKGFLGTENKPIAVKVLNLRMHGAAKTFMAECEALRGIRHRNLVKLVTACSSIDFKGDEFRALVYEFMPNGNLDTWLHLNEVEGTSSNRLRAMTLLERLNIAIDVASVFHYLHAYSHTPIVHCDLKPSNVLLDDDMTAHVGDFGLARILFESGFVSSHNQFSSAGIRGTIGYAAPEYGMGWQPSTMGDAYSFGILLLEMFTGKRPTDELFSNGVTLYGFTKSALPERVVDVVDRSILSIADARLKIADITECLKLVLHVGIRCSEESATDRLTMAAAVRELVLIKDRFFRDKKATRRRTAYA